MIPRRELLRYSWWLWRWRLPALLGFTLRRGSCRGKLWWACWRVRGRPLASPAGEPAGAFGVAWTARAANPQMPMGELRTADGGLQSA